MKNENPPIVFVNVMSSQLSKRINELTNKLNSFPISNETGSKSKNDISNSLKVLNNDQSMKTIKKALNNIKFNDSQSELEWLLLARLTLIIYDKVVKDLLKKSVILNQNSQYWMITSQSKYRTYGYLLQTLPIRSYNYMKNVNYHDFNSFFLLSNYNANFNRNSILNLRTLTFKPINFVEYEIESHFNQLNVLKDEIADAIGQLAAFEGLQLGFGPDSGSGSLGKDLSKWLSTLIGTINNFNHTNDNVDHGNKGEIKNGTNFNDIFSKLKYLVDEGLPNFENSLIDRLKEHSQPNAVTRSWPKLLLGPPIIIFIVKNIINSKELLIEYLNNFKETIKGFFNSWIIEPSTNIINTIRFGGHGLGVTQAGLESDIASLERMVLDLGKENLKLSDQDLINLSRNVRNGDLTAVLNVYENEMKTPFKSAIFGQLVRALLIQIQKVKCDVDTTMTKLDALLKSQELTFGFVGVAPSLAILYLLMNIFSRFLGLFTYKKTINKYKKIEIFELIRFVDGLLLPSQSSSFLSSTDLGHLLLSTSIIRNFINDEIKSNRVRNGILSDLQLLEISSDPICNKRAIVDRMWKSYGGILGWNYAAIQ